MKTKRFLLIFPLLVTLVLAQSFFWVPTYDNQALGNPKRLTRYIHASTGDAQVLSPILNADSASAEITNLVFDGLLDRDEELRDRPRLATGWVQYELAYLTLNPDHRIQGVETPGEFAKWILQRLKKNRQWLKNIQSVKILPPRTLHRILDLPVAEGKRPTAAGEDRAPPAKVDYTLQRPARLRFKLKDIDQDFFEPIRSLLGDPYFARFPYSRLLRAAVPANQSLLKNQYATLLPIEEHNPVIIFNLRQGVRFHDGELFDAEDVLFTYRALMDERNLSPRRADYEPVKTARILGPHKIKFVYKRLFSPAIGAWSIGILPEHRLNREALRKEAQARGMTPEKIESFTLRDSEFNRKPVGTGPFRFVEWQSDEMIHLRRHDQYWEGPPEYAEYIMRIIPDPLTQEMEFYSGAVDRYAVQPHQVARLQHDPKYQSFSAVGLNYSYIGYNMRKPLFADRRVRTALGMAIDVDEIIKYVLYGQGERVTGPYPKITDWYDPTVEPLPHDPEKALRILQELGWRKNAAGWLEKDGKMFEFNLITNNGNPLRKAILAIVQDQWRKIGVKCNTQLFEWAVFLKDFVDSLKYDALVLGWNIGVDPDLYQLWHSSQTGPSQLNFVGFKNREADDLILRIRREYHRDRQVKMARRLHRLIAREQPYTFLYVVKSTTLLDKKIVIVEKGPAGEEHYQKIRPVKGGNILFHFNKWRKLSFAPEFTPDG